MMAEKHTYEGKTQVHVLYCNKIISCQNARKRLTFQECKTIIKQTYMILKHLRSIRYRHVHSVPVAREMGLHAVLVRWGPKISGVIHRLHGTGEIRQAGQGITQSIQ